MLHTQFSVQGRILWNQGILWPCSAQSLLVRQRKKQLILNAKMQFCLTLSKKKISISTSPLEAKIIFNLLSLAADPGAVCLFLTWSHTFVEFDHEIISQ